MEEILKYLIKNNFIFNEQSLLFDYNEENGTKNITHIYTKKDDLSFVFIAPHAGNNFKYLMRVNPTKTLDRWSVCDIQNEYSTEEEVINNFDLIKLYQKLLDIYIDNNIEE